MDNLSQFVTVGLFARLGLLTLTLLGLLVILIILLHTLHILGLKGLLYRKRSPVEGWSRRFYSATTILLALIAALALTIYGYAI